jgi:hypothetical protein
MGGVVGDGLRRESSEEDGVMRDELFSIYGRIAKS